MAMDLVHLASFVSVAERGTVAAAAATLGYTAPAVSQHLAKLERELDARLFDRAGARLVLTSRGRALVPLAHEMLDLDERSRTTLAEATSEQHVVIAGFASALSTVLLPRLAELRRLCTFELVEAEDVDALRDLALGSVDVVLTQEYDGEPVERRNRFAHTPLVTDRLVLVLPPAYPTVTTIDDVADARWLLNGRATRCADATRRVLDAHGVVPQIVGTIADNATLLALVAAGEGVTVVPSRVLDHARAAVTVAETDLGVARTIVAVTRTASIAGLAPVLALLGDRVGDVSATRPSR